MGNPKILPMPKDYVPADGMPSIANLNERTISAMNRLQVRGVMPQPNPLVTAWQVRAIMHLLCEAGLIKQEDYAYYTAYFQVQDLERLVEEKPPAGLVVPTSQRPPFPKNGN